LSALILGWYFHFSFFIFHFSLFIKHYTALPITNCPNIFFIFKNDYLIQDLLTFAAYLADLKSLNLAKIIDFTRFFKQVFATM